MREYQPGVTLNRSVSSFVKRCVRVSAWSVTASHSTEPPTISTIALSKTGITVAPVARMVTTLPAHFSATINSLRNPIDSGWIKPP